MINNPFQISANILRDKSVPKNDQIMTKIHDILLKVYGGNNERNKVIVFSNRINFSCPFCGDSKTNDNKRRGNIYTDSWFYKCYNCGISRPVDVFFEELSNELDLDFDSIDKNLYRNLRLNAASFIQKNQYDALKKNDINKYLFPLEEIEKKFNWTPISNHFKIKKYLNERLLFDMNLFRYDEKDSSIVILNMDWGEKHLLSFSKRFFTFSTRYLQYNLRNVYELLNKKIDDEDTEFKQINFLSNYFNIMNLDLTSTITILEGPIDSFFVYNSLALNGLTKQSPFETSEQRFLFDNDNSGKKKSIEMLKEGFKVFLWNAVLKDYGIKNNINIKDLNDLMIYLNRNRKDIDINNYFSDSQYDLYLI